jgi:hypothetical protein
VPDRLVVPVRRVLSPAEGTALVGETVAAEPGPPTVPRVTPDRPAFLVDETDGSPVAIVTVLPRDRIAVLRRAVLGLEMATVARMSSRMAGQGRTFGWAPRRVVNGRESCRATSANRDFPGSYAVLDELADQLSAQFAGLLPARARADAATLAAEVKSDWRMGEESLWTSGVVNRSSLLPYHRDSMNFHTWSAMPTLRYGMRGGYLHVPEYDIVFPCRDGEVTWFCGRDLVHGVTPMRMQTKDAYRYSVVYYALSGMRNCRTFAEETAEAAQRRTDRERKLAAEARKKLAALHV